MFNFLTTSVTLLLALSHYTKEAQASSPSAYASPSKSSTVSSFSSSSSDRLAYEACQKHRASERAVNSYLVRSSRHRNYNGKEHSRLERTFLDDTRHKGKLLDDVRHRGRTSMNDRLSRSQSSQDTQKMLDQVAKDHFKSTREDLDAWGDSMNEMNTHNDLLRAGQPSRSELESKLDHIESKASVRAAKAEGRSLAAKDFVARFPGQYSYGLSHVHKNKRKRATT